MQATCFEHRLPPFDGGEEPCITIIALDEEASSWMAVVDGLDVVGAKDAKEANGKLVKRLRMLADSLEANAIPK